MWVTVVMAGSRARPWRGLRVIVLLVPVRPVPAFGARTGVVPGQGNAEIGTVSARCCRRVPPAWLVRLISADPGKAMVEVEGERQELHLGSSVSASYQPRLRREIRIMKGNGGYFVDGPIQRPAGSFSRRHRGDQRDE